MAISLSSILPAPTQRLSDREDEERSQKIQSQLMPVASNKVAPPYGHRKGWIPRSQEDFGDGGAFPEIAIAQYPLNMGKKKSSSNALAVSVDATGKLRYDAIARHGHAQDKVVFSRFDDLVPKQFDEDDPELQRPDEEEVMSTTEKTKQALEKLVAGKISAAMPVRAADKQAPAQYIREKNKQALEKLVAGKISAAMPVRAADKQAPAQYIRYTPSQQGVAFNSGAKQRIIRMVEVQKDPMEPPRFKTNKKIPRGPPSPPAPVMHSPNRKVSVKEQQEWKIPPCISNWTNAKGYTIPLDKRLAADGRGLQSAHVNENFAKLAEALFIADRKAREAVEMRAQIETTMAYKEKEKREDNLRTLAQKVRDERSGVKKMDDRDDELKDREDFRKDRAKERARDRNLARAAPDKRNRLQKERDRDISEKIALGVPNAGRSNELEYDQRLFNQSRGMDSGFGGGEDESYNVYDKPWRQDKNIGSSIYRPSKNVDKDVYGDDLDKLVKSNRFVPDREFAGTDRTSRRDGPVQFQKEEEEDPFGLNNFLRAAKTAEKRPAEDSRSRDHKRRKD